MNRSPTLTTLRHLTTGVALTLAMAGTMGMATVSFSAAHAQNTNAAVSRPFPPNAPVGTVVIGNSPEATINGKAVRTAPGLRVFDMQNRLVHAHQLQGQKIKVRYVVEPATGFLQTVWILAPHEIPKTRWFGLSAD